MHHLLVVTASDFSFDSLSVSVLLHTNIPSLLSESTQKNPMRSNWNLQEQNMICSLTFTAQQALCVEAEQL